MESTQTDRDNCYSQATTVRYATIVVDPGADGFYPESRIFLERANVTRERVHHVDVLDDGTIVGLYELHGDADRIRSGVRYLPRVLSYDVTGTDPVFLYLHEEATEPVSTLFTLLRSSKVVLDRPFEHRTDGTFQLTIVGEDDALSQTFDSLADIVTVDLVETGEYHPELSDLDMLLTDRQRQILRLAVQRGYYEVPRKVTHQKLADESDLSQSTVAERLQKIEANVLPHVI